MDAKCGHHPDRSADGGTCGRCGTYLCAACVVPGSHPALCTECLALLDRGPEVRHVRILSILLMVHGGLLLLLGGSYLLYGVFFLDALSDLPAPSSPDAGLTELMVGGFGVMGLAQLAPGVLQALAGWRLFRYRGLGLAWAGALGGVLSVFGCYCGPTALALAGYGAYVLSRPDVRARLAVRVGPASPRP